jgi:hypothetical protein
MWCISSSRWSSCISRCGSASPLPLRIFISPHRAAPLRNNPHPSPIPPIHPPPVPPLPLLLLYHQSGDISSNPQLLHRTANHSFHRIGGLVVKLAVAIIQHRLAPGSIPGRCNTSSIAFFLPLWCCGGGDKSGAVFFCDGPCARVEGTRNTGLLNRQCDAKNEKGKYGCYN